MTEDTAALPTQGTCVLVCASHSFPTPTLQQPDESSTQPSILPKFYTGCPDTSLTHKHTLSPKEEIKSQMRGAWGGISQTSLQELRVRLPSKLSKLQL